MSRARIRAGAALGVLLLLTGCGAPHLTAPPPSKVDVATPQMVALKAKGKIEDCPAPETTGGPLPKVTLKCLGGGRSVDLSTLKGPLIINFWQADCTPCRKEMPALEAFHRQYGAQVPILGIDSTDVAPGVALKQAINRGVTYPLAADPGSELQATKLRIHGFPTFFLLSADGKITYHAGGLTSVDQIRQMVDQAMGLHL